ncbi:hypothetical protein [Fusobacterium sp. MFO224]|uniref:hypothetical protein n=1 Tax=Fusobacterium sp. MFO224 TaxID=3378070 RepID=UPI003854C587
MIKIKAFKAGAGESFLLYFPEEKFNILIDGGFGTTYSNSIKPALNEIKNRGEILDLLIITHMCKDHILGIIKLLEENGSNRESKIIKIKEIWVNSFFNSNIKSDQIRLPSHIEKLLNTLFPYSTEEKCIGNISADQLKTLSEYILKGGYIVNLKPLQVETVPLLSRNNIDFKFLSPTKQILKELEKEFIDKIPEDIDVLKDSYRKEISKYYERFFLENFDKKKLFIGNISSPTLEDLANSNSEEDDNISNKSSLAFVIEYKDKKLIFLGDSIPSLYLKGLEKNYSNLEEIKFDLVKIAHHGSENNNPSDFFKKINSKIFLISTNGNNYNHPDEKTIARLIFWHKNKSNIFINCENENLYKFVKNDRWKKIYNYNLEKKNNIEI